MPSAFGPGLSLDPARINVCGAPGPDGTSGNSGFQALNLAVLMGAARVILLGFDMGFGAGGEVHWHRPHAWRDPRTGSGLHNPTQRLFDRWIRGFAAALPDLARAGVSVLNASRRTALDCFPRITPEDAFAETAGPLPPPPLRAG